MKAIKLTLVLVVVAALSGCAGMQPGGGGYYAGSHFQDAMRMNNELFMQNSANLANFPRMGENMMRVQMQPFSCFRTVGALGQVNCY